MNLKTVQEAKSALIAAGMDFCSRKSTSNRENKSFVDDCLRYFSTGDNTSSSFQSWTSPTKRKHGSLSEKTISDFNEQSSPNAMYEKTGEENTDPRRCRKASAPVRCDREANTNEQKCDVSKARAYSLGSCTQTVACRTQSRNYIEDESEIEFNRGYWRSHRVDREDNSSLSSLPSRHQKGPYSAWPPNGSPNDKECFPDEDSRNTTLSEMKTPNSQHDSPNSRRYSLPSGSGMDISGTGSRMDFSPYKDIQLHLPESSMSFNTSMENKRLARKISMPVQRNVVNRPTTAGTWTPDRLNMEFTSLQMHKDDSAQRSIMATESNVNTSATTDRGTTLRSNVEAKSLQSTTENSHNLRKSAMTKNSNVANRPTEIERWTSVRPNAETMSVQSTKQCNQSVRKCAMTNDRNAADKPAAGQELIFERSNVEAKVLQTTTPKNSQCARKSSMANHRLITGDRWKFVRSDMEAKIFQSFIEANKTKPITDSEKSTSSKEGIYAEKSELYEDVMFQEFYKTRFVRRNAICEVSEQEREGLKTYLNLYLKNK